MVWYDKRGDDSLTMIDKLIVQGAVVGRRVGVLCTM